MSEIIKSFTVNGKPVQVLRDDLCESPRTSQDNLFLWSARDKSGYRDKGALLPWEIDGDPVFWLNHTAFPLYLYRHGGDVLSVTSFSDPWDSGQLGYAYVSRERLTDFLGWKHLNKQRKAYLFKRLKSEVAEMNNWLNGSSYGIAYGEDSVWGFIVENIVELAEPIHEYLGVDCSLADLKSALAA